MLEHGYKGYLRFFVLFCMVFVSGCSFFSSKKGRKTPYVIAQPKQWEQLSLYGTNQNVTGFSSDLLFEIAQLGQIKIEVVTAEDRLLPGLLASGKVDGIVTLMPVNSLTQQKYTFTTPYFVTGIVVVVRIDASYASIYDLHNVTIGYDVNEGLEVTKNADPSWILRPYETAVMSIEDLMKGRIDGVIIDSINASRINKSYYKSHIKVLAPPLQTNQVRLAVLKGKNTELIDAFDATVIEYMKSGRYREMLNYWGIEGYTVG